MNELGKSNYSNIVTAIDFLSKNKLEKNTFLLQKQVFDEIELNNLLEKERKIKENIEKKVSVEKYFSSLKDLLTNDLSKNKIDDLLKIYDSILDDLKYEYKNLKKKINKIEFDKYLTEIINIQIENSIDKLGNREKTVKSRQEILLSETNKMINNLKKELLKDIDEKKLELVFPYNELKNEIELNSNEYARLTLDDSEFNVENNTLDNSKIFNLENVKTKIKSLKIENINLLNSESTKKLINQLNTIGINLSELIAEYSEIPKNIELFLGDDGWKLINDINKGDIAKKSIEFYFNKLIKEKQPDIIFIDQPENDVDKSFISETLSSFIKKQKIEKQIIVTSHDAIVAINSDANMIIEASINKNNKISYDSYCIEYVEEEKLVATNKVSLILDGGKKNIKKRYQIYGGELTYEN